MGFLFPVFLLGALAMAVPIVLHLARREAAPEVPFTAVRLLRGSPLPRSRPRRLRDLLLLGARIAGLLLLAAAFARPYVASGAAEGGVAIVAVDRSYSMGSPGRFERALALARDEINSAAAHRPIAVVAFDDGAAVVAPPGTAAAAHTGLDQLRAGFGGTAYAPLFARALAVAGGTAATLTIIGDLQRRGWDGVPHASLPASLEMEVRDVGPVPQNASVRQVRSVPGGVMATIASAGEEPFAGMARLRVDETVVAEVPVSVEAAGWADVTFHQVVPAGAAVAVEIDDTTGLAADNVRYLVAGSSHPGRVLVLGADGRRDAYAARALAAADAEHVPAVRSVPAADAGRPSEVDWSDVRAVLLLSTRGLDRTARTAVDRFVRGGGGLMVTASDRTEGAVLAAMLDWPDFEASPAPAARARLAVRNRRHPIFQPFGGFTANLGDVRFTRLWKVEGNGWGVVARFTDGSRALIERPHGAGRVLLFASDLDLEWNDFPLQAAFVPFVVESIRYLAAPAPSAERIVPHTPAGVGPHPGVYTAGETGRRVAVNVDLAESSPVRLTAEDFLAMLPAAAGAPAGTSAINAADLESRQNYWRYGMLLLLTVLVAESFLGRWP